MTARTRLVLLTSHFPVQAGDAAFLQHEIAALSSQFDEVIVFNRSEPSGRSLYPLPPNVRYFGTLSWRGGKYKIALRKLRPDRVFKMLGFALADWRVGRLRRGQFRHFTRACSVGMKLSMNPRFQEVIASDQHRVLVYSFWGTGSALVIPWLPRRIKSVVRLHRFDLYEEVLGYLPLRTALFAAVERIISISEDGRRYLLDRYPDLELDSKLAISRLGTADHGISETNPERRLTIMSCSHLKPVKRVDRIVGALSVMNSERPIRWVHFGGGGLESELSVLAAALSAVGIEVDLRGDTPNEEVIDFYRTQRVDVFVNTSESEGVPVSIMEAMSFGVPVVATAVGGTPEVVGSQLRSGILLDPAFSDQQLADAIQAVLSAPPGRYSSREVWKRMSDGERNSGELAALLMSTLSGTTT